MKRRDDKVDYAGLIAIRLDPAIANETTARALVSAALQPFASEPLVWSAVGRTLARLKREDHDPTATHRVLTIERTLTAASAIHESWRGRKDAIWLACDVEPTGDDAAKPEYWVRRQRLDQLADATEVGIACRREMIDARAYTLSKLHAHFEPASNGRDLRLVEGPATQLVGDLGRWVTAYVDSIPSTWFAGGFLDVGRVNDRKDVARIASPTGRTRVVLILAEAWVGKSYVARSLRDALLARGLTVWFTSMESSAVGWPTDEFFRRADARVWMIDAADEAERQRFTFRNPERPFDRPGLTTIIFSRPDSTLREVERFFGFEPSPSVRPTIEHEKVRLLPLDRAQARRELALDEDAFTQLAARAATYSAPLTFEELRELSTQHTGQANPPPLHELRSRIARHRCTRLRTKIDLIGSADEVFSAAKLIAAIAALTNEREFTFGETGPGFSVNDVLPKGLIDAGLSLRNTVALTRSGSSWCFAPAHIEEDLAAAFLVDSIRKSASLTVQGLRSLLTDGQRPRPELQRVIERVHDGLAGNEDAIAKLKSALRPFEDGEAVRRFREMVDVAATSERPVWVSQEPLLWLNCDAVRGEASRLLGGAQPAAVHHLTLQFALANDGSELASAATPLALAADATPVVRQLAVKLASRDSAQLGDLATLLSQIPRDSADDLAAVRAEIILQLLLHHRMSPLDAARGCPRAQRNLIDSRALAIAEVERQLDAESARVVLDELRESVPRTIDDGVRDELRNAALSAFLRSDLDADSADVGRLAFVFDGVHGFDLAFDEMRRLGGANDAVRRAVYQRLDVEQAKPSYILDYTRDAEWLIGLVEGLTSLSQNVVGDLFNVVGVLQNRRSELDAERGRRALRRHEVWDAFCAHQARVVAHQEQQREWLRAREAQFEETRKHALPLERLLDTFRGDPRDASVRVHVLGEFFFGQRSSGRNVVGTFEEDLNEQEQSDVMALTRAALSEATPLPIPQESSFSSLVLHEGYAFRAAALWNREWLDASQVERWLPTALFASMGDSESRTEELLERCFGVAAEQTRRAVLGDIARSAQRGHPQTHHIPRVLWSDEGFRAGLVALAHRLNVGDEYERKALGDVLDALLDAYDTAVAPSEVRALLRALLDGKDDAIAKDTIRAWFRRWPVECADEAIRSTTTIDDALVVFAPYYRYQHHRRALPAAIAPRIAPHLMSVVPQTRPFEERRSGWGPIEDSDPNSIAEWRDGLVWSCIGSWSDSEAASPELRTAIDAIRNTEPYAGWLAHNTIGVEMEAVFSATTRPWPQAGDVAEILHGALALIHDVQDLAALIAEVIGKRWDESLTPLFFTPDGRPRENLLQVFLRDKLVDGLANARPPVDATPFREPSERGTDEPDFVVVTTNRAPRLEVPIEVKWSYNKPVEGLEEQLGERYLGNAGRTHGVYVVGWMGEPKREHLDKLLEAARLGQAEQGRTIYVVTKDLLPPQATKAERTSKSMAARPKPSAAPASRPKRRSK